MRKIHLLLLIAVLWLPVQAWAQTGETVFVSTFTNGLILSLVDSSTPTFSTVNSSSFSPEGMVVGPDAKLYVCDSDNNQIRRMNQDGSNVETVYTKGDSSGPAGPEGASFSTKGDLYFNTRGPSGATGVWKITSTQLSGTLPVTPTNVVTALQTGSTFGEGTTFDAQDNLLIVDRSGGKVWRFDTATSTLETTPLISGLDTPIGIAVNNVGDIFVAERGPGLTGSPKVSHWGTDGSSKGTYVDSSGTAGNFAVGDHPQYLRFDASGILFVATEQISDTSVESHGKVWRVAPPSGTATSGTATLIATLPCAGELCTPPLAVGLALPPTTFSTAEQAVFPGALVTFADGNVINQTWSFPADANMGSPATAFMSVDFIQVAPGVFNSTRLPGIAQNPNWSLGTTPVPAGTAITPIAGTGGNSILMRGHCSDVNHIPIVPCDISAPRALIQLISKYKTQSPEPNPAMIIGDDQGTPNQNDWADITDFFDPTDPRIGGGTAGTTVEVAIVNLGGTSPSFTYNACLLYDPTHAVKSGAAIPIKISLCDTSGRPLSSADIVVHAAQLVQVSSGTTDTIIDAGDSNAPDNDFRYDASLGTRGGYIFNLKTMGLATGTYNLFFTAGFDTTLHLIGPPTSPFTFQVK